MSLLLKRIKIRDFLGSRDIDVDFFDDVNFLIGKNGTGKTTFIKIVNHVLSLEIAELRGYEFTDVTFYFFDPSKNVDPVLRITRSEDTQTAFVILFKEKSSDKFRRYASKSTISFTMSRMRDQVTQKSTDAAEEIIPYNFLVNHIRENLRYSWLPLLRYGASRVSSPFDEDEGDSFDRLDPINNKIEDLVTRSARYFSVLDFRAASETRTFQKNYFLSLLSTHDSLNLDMAPDFHKSYDNQQRVMQDIFSELGFEQSEFRSSIDKHFERLRNAAVKISNRSDGVDLEDLVTVSNNAKLQDIVERFQSYEKKKADIYQPKDNFISIINSFFFNKTLSFSESNEPTIQISNSEKHLSPYELSSGERQIFVILCETLLQEGQTHIFLADEPELSLHVEWQEALVRKIRDLNSKCQLVFATHSPDLISIYQDRVINFDRL